MDQWKQHLNEYIVRIVQLFEADREKLGFNRSTIAASDVVEQFFCEKKVEMQYLHGEIESEAKFVGTEAHQCLDRKWHLRFKGFLAVMVIRPTPKMWNPKWKEIFNNKAKIIEQYAEPYLKKYGFEKEDMHNAVRNMGLNLDNFNLWIEFSKKVKQLLKDGVINFDVIKEETLFGLILLEVMTVEELSEIWGPPSETNGSKQDFPSPM